MRLPTIKQAIFFCLGTLILLVATITPELFQIYRNYTNVGQEKWLESTGVPESIDSYVMSEWSKAVGHLKAAEFSRGRVDTPARRDAKIVAYRTGRRNTLLLEYTFCQAQYRLADGSIELWYATCPERRIVALRPYVAELITAVLVIIGVAFIWGCFVLPNRRMQATPSGVGDPER